MKESRFQFQIIKCNQIILNVDNHNIKFNDIYDIIKTDLENEDKYPEILREGKYIPKIEVDVMGMQGWTRQIRVRILYRQYHAQFWIEDLYLQNCEIHYKKKEYKHCQDHLLMMIL